MKLRVMTAVLACKLCRALIRLLGRGGTDFPGRVALKLCPNLLGELARNVTTVIVTGTNGKTTTSRMIEQSWQDAGISYFANNPGQTSCPASRRNSPSTPRSRAAADIRTRSLSRTRRR